MEGGGGWRVTSYGLAGRQPGRACLDAHHRFKTPPGRFRPNANQQADNLNVARTPSTVASVPGGKGNALAGRHSTQAARSKKASHGTLGTGPLEEHQNSGSQSAAGAENRSGVWRPQMGRGARCPFVRWTYGPYGREVCGHELPSGQWRDRLRAPRGHSMQSISVVCFFGGGVEPRSTGRAEGRAEGGGTGSGEGGPQGSVQRSESCLRAAERDARLSPPLPCASTADVRGRGWTGVCRAGATERGGGGGR